MNMKKLCCFYLNDIHLITMLLPYINERIDQSTKIVTILEKNISESAERVIPKVHLKNSESLLNINWKEKDVKDVEKLDLDNNLVIVSGGDGFIKKVNEILNNRNQEKFDILNCFQIMQANNDLYKILDYHDKIVNTSGEKFPEEVFTEYTPKVYKKITL